MTTKKLSEDVVTVDNFDEDSLSLEASKDLHDVDETDEKMPVELNMTELKSELGIPSILTSVEEIKALVHELVGKRKAPEHLGQNALKKMRSEEASDTRATNTCTSEFDPTEAVEVSSTPDKELFPSVFDDLEDSGPKISEKLAQRGNEACTKKAFESKMKELEAKYHTPENCTSLGVPKVNSELWHDLPRTSKTKDLALQEVQRGIVEAVQPMLTVLEDAMAAQKSKAKIDPATIVSKLADCVTFLCHASYKTSMTRRENLKDVINIHYRSVCGQNTPLGKCLFGDELPKHIKDIAEVNKLSKKISSGQRG